jgi:small-conductance mechanosensitive channel
MTGAMAVASLREWFAQNHDGLLIGAVVAGAIAAALLLLRLLGQRASDRDPEHHTWGSILGGALARTGIFFIIAAAADGFSTYANLPHRVARVIDIAFIVAFALQGAIWARELILGLIARKVSEADGGSTLANATALIRVLVSFTAFAIAIILILDNLGVNVTALVAGLGIGGIAIVTSSRMIPMALPRLLDCSSPPARCSITPRTSSRVQSATCRVARTTKMPFIVMWTSSGACE